MHDSLDCIAIVPALFNTVLLHCRYVYATEACHRLFGFEVSHQVPSVTRLAIHEEGQQAVCFRSNENAATVLNRRNTSSLLEWFKTNNEDPAAREYNALWGARGTQ